MKTEIVVIWISLLLLIVLILFNVHWWTYELEKLPRLPTEPGLPFFHKLIMISMMRVANMSLTDEYIDILCPTSNLYCYDTISFLYRV